LTSIIPVSVSAPVGLPLSLGVARRAAGPEGVADPDHLLAGGHRVRIAERDRGEPGGVLQLEQRNVAAHVVADHLHLVHGIGRDVTGRDGSGPIDDVIIREYQTV
jgi:hypothetical protein